MNRWFLVGAIILGLLWTGCVRRRSPEKGPNVSGEVGKNTSTSSAQQDPLVKKGKDLYTAKGCIACHSVDGSPRVGPTYKGLFGKKKIVFTKGEKREIIADEDYLIRAIRDPNADVVEGYTAGMMVITVPVSDEETKALVAYIKSLNVETVGPQAGRDLLATRACLTCHTTDEKPSLAPSYKGLFGDKITVITDGKERELVADEAYIRKSIKEPNADVVKGYHANMMPSLNLSDTEIDSIIAYIKTLPGPAPKNRSATMFQVGGGDTAPPITVEEMKEASGIFFNRCAGCHGMLRKGATGPALMPKQLTEKRGGSEGIKAILTYGLPGGMPAWGKLGILKEREMDLLSRFLQHEPPSPPEMSIGDMKNTWKLLVPEDKRPKAAFHKGWENFFGIVLRDAGKVAILDGTTKELISIVDTGFAVHILRSSASGRYFYSIGRDGKVTMIDLWMEKPDKVAEVKVCYDARSVDSSKFKGFEDKYLIVGGYWPPSLIIMDGKTLEPLKVVCTSSYTLDDYTFLREARAAAIVASHKDPLWVVNIKETGYVWLVDYSDLSNLKITQIPGERFLHDGGWDSTHRYVLMAANAKNTIVVVDTETKKKVTNILVGKIPHPGRGANINHPKYGPLWLTGHLGDNTISCIGTDPEKHPEYAWKVVKTMELPGAGGGNLFIKTHPNSPWIWADRPLHTDSKVCRTVYVFDKNTLELKKEITLPEQYPGRAVHFEYNKEGTEIWIAAWSPMTSKSALVIYDDKKLEVIKEIAADWLITPTGKFNATNTTKDIY